jgi:hypothetical protein
LPSKPLASAPPNSAVASERLAGSRPARYPIYGLYEIKRAIEALRIEKTDIVRSGEGRYDLVFWLSLSRMELIDDVLKEDFQSTVAAHYSASTIREKYQESAIAERMA